MAKRPIKQIEVPGTTPTTYDIQDNTLVEGANITITEETDGTRKINADVPVKTIATAPGSHINTPGTPTVTVSTSGTTTTLTFDYLKGAKGDKGNTGDTGAQGPAGQDGLTTSIKVNGTTYTQTSGLITLPNYPTVPTNISSFTNDAGYITSHQSIKSLNTNNSTAQSASSSEAIAGTGTINLHKVSKTGSYNDLLNKPTIPTDATGISYDTSPTQFSGNTVADALDDIDHILDEKGSGTVTSVAIQNDTNGGLTISSGSPITSSGTIKLKHSNVLSASGTIGSSSASSGATLAVPYANYDINGHITSKGTHTHTINNLTSSAINSSYKLPTTTEWSEKASITVNPSSTTNTITSIGINGTNYQLGTFQQLGVAYYMATCNQPGATKTVTLPSYSLTTNASAIIYFMYTSTSSSTLNINSTGAKTMRINNNTISSTNRLIEGIYFVRYSGIYYDCYYMSTVGKKYLHRTHLTIKESASSAKYCHLILNWWSSSPSPYTSASSLMLEFGGNDHYDAQFDQDGVQFSGYFEYTSTNYVPIVKFSFRQEWEYDGDDEYYVDTYCDVMYTRSASSTTTLSWGSADFANLASVTDYVIE